MEYRRALFIPVRCLARRDMYLFERSKKRKQQCQIVYLSLMLMGVPFIPRPREAAPRYESMDIPREFILLAVGLRT
jgi:hypothetical protein